MNHGQYLKAAASLRPGVPVGIMLMGINSRLQNALDRARRIEAFEATGLPACEWCRCAEQRKGDLFCSDVCDLAERRDNDNFNNRMNGHH